ncbi:MULTISPECIES: toxin-antitoxin system YwqK family antitoxin [Halomonas]|nr:hypothetical protein [Halomonas ventosae]
MTVATAKAINNGVELLDELAEGAQKSSELLLIKTKASGLDKEIHHLINNSANPKEIQEKRQDLSEKYDELINKTLDSERDDYVSKNKSLQSDMILSSISEMEKSVETKEQALSIHNFELAITEILKLENIKADLEHLLRITQSSQYNVAHQKAQDKLNSITILIADLQEKRHEENSSLYLSGDRKSRTRLYDGKNHGLSEFWYEDGTKEKEISFSHGILCGMSRYWRNDGTILSEISNQPINSSFTHSVFSRNGTKILEGSQKDKKGYIDIWLWDGSFVCRANMNNCKVSRTSFLLKAVMRKNVWANLYRARKPGSQQELFNDMTETMESHTKFSYEMANYLTRGKAFHKGYKNDDATREMAH